MKRTFILMGAFVLLIGLPNTRGQSIGPSILNSTGGTRTVGTSEYDWSVGEVAIVSTFYGPKDKNIIVTQGVLQNELSAPEKEANTTLAQHLLVFPNPASSLINLQYSSTSAGILSYRLMDMSGKVIMNSSREINQGMTAEQLNIGQLAVASYLLEVTFKDNSSNTEAKSSYKIEKLN